MPGNSPGIGVLLAASLAAPVDQHAVDSQGA
jgi:hypothetical protein